MLDHHPVFNSFFISTFTNKLVTFKKLMIKKLDAFLEIEKETIHVSS